MIYKCIKEICLPKYDGDGFEIPNEYVFITVGSIWKRDDSRCIVGGDVHLNSMDDDFNLWLEMSFENLEENFALMRMESVELKISVHIGDVSIFHME